MWVVSAQDELQRLLQAPLQAKLAGAGRFNQLLPQGLCCCLDRAQLLWFLSAHICIRYGYNARVVKQVPTIRDLSEPTRFGESIAPYAHSSRQWHSCSPVSIPPRSGSVHSTCCHSCCPRCAGSTLTPLRCSKISKRRRRSSAVRCNRRNSASSSSWGMGEIGTASCTPDTTASASRRARSLLRFDPMRAQVALEAFR